MVEWGIPTSPPSCGLLVSFIVKLLGTGGLVMPTCCPSAGACLLQVDLVSMGLPVLTTWNPCVHCLLPHPPT